MQTDLTIDFHGSEASEAVRDLIARHVDALEHFSDRLTACHVMVKPPGHHKRKGGQYEIRIWLTLPDGREVDASNAPVDARNADILFSVNDAFRRARRQLQDSIGRMRE